MVVIKPFEKEVNLRVSVPGSKSITNRALLLAALAEGTSTLRGCGMSGDSRVFLEALKSLGFSVTVSEYSVDGAVTYGEVAITGCGGEIPEKKASVSVGSAGTAARFLTAMMALSDGEYKVDSSEQMKRRPMRPLLEALELLGAGFIFHEKPYSFPFFVRGATSGEVDDSSTGSGIQEEEKVRNSPVRTIPLNIDSSSQFLSALLLCKPMVPYEYEIRLTGRRQALSYVRITERMMQEFSYQSFGDHYLAREYEVEPDVSAACYFYAMAAIHGGTVRVKGIKGESMQGDIRFLSILERMGCSISEDEGEICVKRDPSALLHGIDVDMSDCSDQTMTLACVAPFADSPTTIRGVAHIRGQESDRIAGIASELNRLGIRCEEREDGVVIHPIEPSGESRVQDSPVIVKTYDDHRMAMAFALIGTKIPGVGIENPECCRKTFEGYFELLAGLS